MNQESQHTPTDAQSSASRKLGLSCAECRRSKLKCDRVFPCQSCVRRGCAGICPDGTLAATKGNKVLMAHAQRLQEQVKALTTRCRSLEKELADSRGNDLDSFAQHQSHQSDGDAPEPINSVDEGFGSLSIGVHGQAKYHGETSSSEYFQDLLPSQEELAQSSDQLDLPPDIVELMNVFPFGYREAPYSKEIFFDYIPDLSNAQRLADLYFINTGWMYEPVTRQDFRTNVLEVIYGPNGERNIEKAHAHQISLLFIVLANGAPFHDDPRTIMAAKVYQALARAAFSLDSILSEATTASVQTLFLIVRFIYNVDRDRNEERWLLTGLNSRLAHMVGLQRDSANWNLPAEDVQRRRRLFWELFVWDAWTSVVNGRPAALAVQHTDCQFPDDIDPVIKPSKEMEIGWHAWKCRYGANILTASSYHVFSPRTPPYKALLELDKKIRSFPIPSHLRSPVRNSDANRSWNADPSRAMQQYCALCLRESNLLYIHRSYFAMALRQMPGNPLQHPYAASVLATYRSAIRLIVSLRSLYAIHPRLTSTVWYFWSGVFSSCIVLGALVVECPACTLARDALGELQIAVPFYEVGSRKIRSPSTMPILEKLLARALSAGSGLQPSSPSSEVDELQVLGGRKAVIKPTSNGGSPPMGGAPGTPSSIIVDSSDDGNSPSSNTGAMEMLQEYYGSIGQQPPRFDPEKGYVYQRDLVGVGGGGGGSAAASYKGEDSTSFSAGGGGAKAGSTYSAQPFGQQQMMGSPGEHQQQAQQGLDYQASQIQIPVAGPSNHAAPASPTTHQHQQQQQSHPHQLSWQSSYGSPPLVHASHPAENYPQQQQQQQQNYHHHHQQQQQHHQQNYNSSPLLYGHPLNVNPPHAYPQIIQRYPHGAAPEPTQEEIWRDFMVGYQQPC